MNPILSALNQQTQNPLTQIKSLLSGKNPDAVFSDLMQNNSQFRSFVEQNKGKTPEQIAKENGLNIEQIKAML